MSIILLIGKDYKAEIKFRNPRVYPILSGAETPKRFRPYLTV